jgi:hypothetical protein
MDFAAAPIQPIVEGIVTYPGGLGTAPIFDGKGVSAIVRDPATGGLGGFILTLDAGLPGNAGAVPFGPSPPLLPDPDVRTLVVPLGIAVVPPLSGIASIGVSYIPSALAGVGAPQIEVVFTNAVFVPHDPKGGFLIVVWRGLGGGIVA